MISVCFELCSKIVPGSFAFTDQLNSATLRPEPRCPRNWCQESADCQHQLWGNSKAGLRLGAAPCLWWQDCWPCLWETWNYSRLIASISWLSGIHPGQPQCVDNTCSKGTIQTSHKMHYDWFATFWYLNLGAYITPLSFMERFTKSQPKCSV